MKTFYIIKKVKAYLLSEAAGEASIFDRQFLLVQPLIPTNNSNVLEPGVKKAPDPGSGSATHCCQGTQTYPQSSVSKCSFNISVLII
jgi:hypothetical protein